jgi:hypothetical protein
LLEQLVKMPRRDLTPPISLDPTELALHRARRLRRKDQQRKAMFVLREACYAAEDQPRLWTLYGVQCLRAGKRAEAIDALTQAAWLRERNHEFGKARVTRQLVARLVNGSESLRAA